MFVELLKGLFNLFCGVASPPPEKPSVQQSQYPPPSQPQWQPAPHHHPAPPHSPHPHTPYQDANQVNQSNEHYVSLRAQANEHGDQMAKAFRESHEAYARGDGALAKQLSNEGKEHQRKMEQLNKQDSKPGEIDLHGLYVKEAISRADDAIQRAKHNGEAQINFIVGKGLHSSGGVAKIKPAIEELIQKYQLTAQLDPTNAGVLIVYLQAAPGQRSIGADEISRRIERNEESCTIM
ncbi:Smr-domain-containing protein [Pholiota conissans]|uniref:Smr-domain-containing protein n=1 Tax=Pholiota conissans TaxID=109636 RepID=A0A9P5Z0M2_9AGAR|nr:Smr-domain-containing protein [Pholiota conissans]